VTDKGCRVITLFPAEELPIANRYWSPPFFRQKNAPLRGLKLRTGLPQRTDKEQVRRWQLLGSTRSRHSGLPPAPQS
jgi:hypothetical protein